MTCAHELWGYDDRGNHWCMSCGLWHDFPHNSCPVDGEPVQHEPDCAEGDGRGD